MAICYYNIVYDNDNPNYLRAAFLGLAIYGTYELTNYATFKDWDLKTLIMDIGWGITVSVLGVFFNSILFKEYEKLNIAYGIPGIVLTVIGVVLLSISVE